MKKTVIILMLLTIITKVMGFGREIVLSYFYGASNISDAYLISLTIPSVIFSLIGTGINTSYIPIYNKICKEKNSDEANIFTNNLISFITIICIIITVFVFIFTDFIVKLFASGFTGKTLETTILFTRIGILNLGFSGLIFVFKGYLNIKKDFISPALMLVPYNIVIILSIIFSSRTDVVVLSVGSTIAVIIQFLFLIPFIKKEGFHFFLIFDYKNKYMKRMLYLSIPIILGNSVNQINKLVDRTIASQITEGGISALNYAHKLDSFIQGIFVLSLATVIYPAISKMAMEGNIKGLKKSISEAIVLIALLVIPATIGIMIFAEPIVLLLFGRGAFDDQAISMTSYALFFYSIGMIGFGLREILSRTFYSLEDTKTPMINASIAMFINIVLNIILSKYLRIGGLALATSISAIICTILLFINLRKKIGSFGMRKITISFIKIFGASLLMGLFAKTSFEFLLMNVNHNLALIISIIVGSSVYFISVMIVKIEQVDIMVNILKHKYKR